MQHGQRHCLHEPSYVQHLHFSFKLYTQHFQRRANTAQYRTLTKKEKKQFTPKRTQINRRRFKCWNTGSGSHLRLLFQELTQPLSSPGKRCHTVGTGCLFTAENSCREGSVFISDRNKQPSLPFYESSTLFLFGDTTRFAAAVGVLGRLSYFSISTGKMSLSDSFFRGTRASSVPRPPRMSLGVLGEVHSQTPAHLPHTK